MGHAAYARGSMAISQQIDRELSGYRVPLPSDECAYLLAEMARLQAKLDRARLHLDERRATLTAERRDREEERSRLLDRCHSAERAMLRYRRDHITAWAIIRAVASPEQVHEARAELLE